MIRMNPPRARSAGLVCRGASSSSSGSQVAGPVHTKYPDCECPAAAVNLVFGGIRHPIANPPRTRSAPLSTADLLNFKHASSVKEALHYTSYALAAGVPAALLLGPPVSSVVDLAMSVVVPLHMHIGTRNILVDYVHDPAMLKVAFAVLAGATVLTTAGLIKFNLTDEGITAALKDLWITQKPPAPPASVAPVSTRY